MRTLSAYTPAEVRATSIPLGRPALLFAVAATVASTVLVGVIPALLGSRARHAADLKSGARTSESRGRVLFRRGLVALQVTMSVVVLVLASLLGRSLMQLRAVDPGFQPRDPLTARVELTGNAYADAASRLRFYAQSLVEIRAIPGVAAASIGGAAALDPDIDGPDAATRR